MGGGAFSAVGTHYVDMVRFILQTEIECVSAVQAPLTTMKPAPTAEGLVSANLRTTAGTPVHILITGRAPGLPAENRVRIVGSTGVIELHMGTSELKLWTGDAAEPIEELPASGNAWSEVGTLELGRRIGAALLDGADADDLGTFRDGVINQRITDAVHASAAQGSTWVSVPT